MMFDYTDNNSSCWVRGCCCFWLSIDVSGLCRASSCRTVIFDAGVSWVPVCQAAVCESLCADRLCAELLCVDLLYAKLLYAKLMSGLEQLHTGHVVIAIICGWLDSIFERHFSSYISHLLRASIPDTGSCKPIGVHAHQATLF